MTTRAQLEQALQYPNVQAFLRVIRAGESSQTDDAYTMMVGGGRFDSFGDHPRERVWIERLRLHSTAAGAYQFLARTWDEVANRYQLMDFSPRSQDIGAVALIERRGALNDVIAGRLDDALAKCAAEWASLPGDVYGQGGISLERARAIYAQYGGQLAGTRAQPITTTKEPPVAPIIAAVLPAIIQAVPDLTKILGSGSEVATRNAQAAERVVQIVQSATQAVNAQEAAEKVATDPAAREAAAQAVHADWHTLWQLADKSVDDARSFNAGWKDGAPFIKTRAVSLRFVEFLSLLLVVFSAVGATLVLAAPAGLFGPEIRASVVTLMLIGGFTGVLQFWLGSSRDSQRKTEMLNK